MSLRIKPLARFDFARDNANSPDRVKACGPESAQLARQFWLTAANACLMKSVRVVQKMNQHLEEIRFASAQFFHFDPKPLFLAVIGTLNSFDQHFGLGLYTLGQGGGL